MLDPFHSGKKKRRSFGLLEIDSAIDSFLFKAFSAIARGYEAFSAQMSRFRVTGFKRALSELFSEGATVAAAGSVVILAFALTAFEETEENWRQNKDYAITFLDRYGREIGKRGILNDDSIPLEEMPDSFIKATLATEDRRFFDHFGIDIIGTFRAMLENARAQAVVQGGSSVTQQLAKNLFLTSERTLERKIKEAFLAIWLEFNLTKKEILKLYLDRSYLGGGAFGIEAASQFYFGKSARDLTLAESAMMAGLFKAPARFAPHVNLPAARARANEVLDNMVEAGFLTEGQVYGARINPATAVSRDGFYSPDYFLDWAYEEVLRIMEGRPEHVLTVKTTVDIPLQQHAEQSVQTMLRQHGRANRVRQSALVSMELDGAVRAIVGGRDYGESQFNRATQALRQPGSSFKPYVYMAALENGYTPRSIVVDAPINIGGWSPRNYGRSYRGAVSLTTALVRSINTVPVRLAQSIGRDKIVETAYKAGIRSELRISRALPLGVAEVTVLDMASGYATFATGGLETTPYGVLTIADTNGNILYDHGQNAPRREQVFNRQASEDLNLILNGVVEQGTGRRAQLPGIKAAGKTGTTQAYRDAWFVGYTGKYATAVWFGNDDFTSTARVTGGRLPAMTWQYYMAFAHNGVSVPSIPGVPGSERLLDTPIAAAGGEGETPAPNEEIRQLSQAAVTVLRRIEDQFRTARALAGRPPVDSEAGGRQTSLPNDAQVAELTDDAENGTARGQR